MTGVPLVVLALIVSFALTFIIFKLIFWKWMNHKSDKGSSNDYFAFAKLKDKILMNLLIIFYF